MTLYIIYDSRNENIVASNFFKNDNVAIDTFQNAIISMQMKAKEFKEKNGFSQPLNLDSLKLYKTTVADSVINSSSLLNSGTDFEIKGE